MKINKFLSAILLLLVFSCPLRADDTTTPGPKNELDEFVRKANVSIRKKDYAQAIAEYEKAYQLNPKHPKVNLLLGLTYAQMGDLDKALKFTQDSLALEESYSGYHNLGLILANKGDYAKAGEAYQKAVSLNPKSYRVWYQIGLLEASNNQYDKAIVAYEKSLELNPKFDDAYIGIGGAAYWAGDKAKALEQVKKLKKLKFKQKAALLEDWINRKERAKSAIQTPSGKP